MANHLCVSESVSGLQAAVFGGMAVTVLGRCALVAGMRELTPEDGFPALPKVDLLLYKAPGVSSPAVHLPCTTMSPIMSGSTAWSIRKGRYVTPGANRRRGACFRGAPTELEPRLLEIAVSARRRRRVGPSLAGRSPAVDGRSSTAGCLGKLFDPLFPLLTRRDIPPGTASAAAAVRSFKRG